MELKELKTYLHLHIFSIHPDLSDGYYVFEMLNAKKTCMQRFSAKLSADDIKDLKGVISIVEHDPMWGMVYYRLNEDI